MSKAASKSGDRGGGDPTARALVRLAQAGAVLAPTPGGRGYGVYQGPDRRRRPAVKLTAAQARALEAEGAIVRRGEGFVLAAAGAARIARATAAPREEFLAQHGPLVDRSVMEADGDARVARGYAVGALRLERLRDVDGTPWLAPHEIAAARRLRADWEVGQAGLMPGSDWAAAPRSKHARGPGNGREGALAIGMDARARVHVALARLAPPLRRIVEALCLNEMGLEEFESVERWPPRSAKVALKMALSQLALSQ